MLLWGLPRALGGREGPASSLSSSPRGLGAVGWRLGPSSSLQPPSSLSVLLWGRPRALGGREGPASSLSPSRSLAWAVGWRPGSPIFSYNKWVAFLELPGLGGSGWTAFMCDSKRDALMHPLAHFWQGYGKTFSWTEEMWIYNFDLLANLVPHSSHRIGFSSSWYVLKWSLKEVLVLKCFLHSLHWILWPSWKTLMWSSNLDWDWYSFSQLSRSHRKEYFFFFKTLFPVLCSEFELLSLLSLSSIEIS